MSVQNEDQTVLVSQKSAEALTHIFAALPKAANINIKSYGLQLLQLENDDAFCLHLNDVEESDRKALEKFIESTQNLGVEGINAQPDHMVIQFKNPDALLTYLIEYTTKNPDGLSLDVIKSLDKKIDDVIKAEATGSFESDVYTDYETGSYTAKEQISDVFNTLLETAGLKNYGADYAIDDNSGRFEIMIDSDGENNLEFVKFCEEIAENAEDAGVEVAIHGNYGEMILNAENELAMITVLRGYFAGYRLMTAEMIARGGPEFDPKAAMEGGLAYMKSMDEAQLCANHPMIHVTAGDNKSMREVFYLKANETTSINLDAIEVAYYQEKDMYAELQDRHRAFIVH